MKSGRILRTNRRGYTVAEMAVSAALVVVVLVGLASILSMAGAMEQTVTLQMDADQSAVQGMNKMITEIREAKEVSVVQPYQFKIYYPVMRSNGRYDRFVTDTNYYVQYAQTTSTGTPSSTGTYLWRSASNNAGRAVAKNIKQFIVSSNDAHSIKLTLRTEKQAGKYKGGTELDGRVLYLRNN